MTKILIADDHFAVRLGLEMLVRDIHKGSCVIEHATNGEDVVNKLHTSEYDMLLLDMHMPEPAGLLLLERALAIRAHLKVLVISVNLEDFFAAKCLQLGAYGFISKNASDQELKKAIEMVIAGKPYIPRSQKDKLIKNFMDDEKDSDPLKSLSPREMDVTMLLLKGMGILEIANALSISQSTASTFKGRIFQKLEIASLLELDQMARCFGLINDDLIQY